MSSFCLASDTVFGKGRQGHSLLSAAVKGLCVYPGSAHFLLNKRPVAKLQRNSDPPFKFGNILKCCLGLYRSAIQVSHNWNFRDIEIILL